MKVQAVPGFAFELCANCPGNTLAGLVVCEYDNLQARKTKLPEAKNGRLMCREPCDSFSGSF